MAENELPIDCKPLDPLDWQKRIEEQSRKCGTEYVNTGDQYYQNVLNYLLGLKEVYSEHPNCCITYMNSSGELGILKCETERGVQAAIEKLNDSLISYN